MGRNNKKAEINEIETKNLHKEYTKYKINKIDETVASLTRKRRRKRPKLVKLEVKKGISQQIVIKSKVLSGNTLKTYIQINWKFSKNG
jgi:hypothetical protein